MSKLIRKHASAVACSDADATAYFAANGVTDPAIIAAVTCFYASAKSHGYYSSIKAGWFGFMGSYSAVKYNMVNPVNSDAAFRITDNGSLTYSASGVTGDGSTGYYDTHFTPSTDGSASSFGIGFYSGTNNAGNLQALIGAADSYTIQFVTVSGDMYATMGDASNIGYTPSNTLGFFYASRTSTTASEFWQNNVSKGTNTSSTTNVPAISLYLLARNNIGSAVFFSPHQMRFSIITTGLNSTQATDLYNDVLTMLTALGIN